MQRLNLNEWFITPRIPEFIYQLQNDASGIISILYRHLYYHLLTWRYAFVLNFDMLMP